MLDFLWICILEKRRFSYSVYICSKIQIQIARFRWIQQLALGRARTRYSASHSHSPAPPPPAPPTVPQQDREVQEEEGEGEGEGEVELLQGDDLPPLRTGLVEGEGRQEEEAARSTIPDLVEDVEEDDFELEEDDEDDGEEVELDLIGEITIQGIQLLSRLISAVVVYPLSVLETVQTLRGQQVLDIVKLQELLSASSSSSSSSSCSDDLSSVSPASSLGTAALVTLASQVFLPTEWANRTWSHEGVLGLWRGIVPYLMAVGVHYLAGILSVTISDVLWSRMIEKVRKNTEVRERRENQPNSTLLQIY